MPMTLSAAAQAPTLKLEQDRDGPAVEILLDHAFGPGRFTKVSERVREIAEFRQDLSFCAWDGARLVGCVRMTRISIGGTQAVFLGPLAVEADVRKFGTGGALVQAACAAAQAAGFARVLLVGDEPYFGRFGFSAAPAKAVRLPGPVDQRRVLVKPLREGGSEGLEGLVAAPLT